MKKFPAYSLIIITAVMLISCAKTVKTDPAGNDALKDAVVNKSESAKEPVNETADIETKDIAIHAGVFTLTMSGYKGEITIDSQDGKLAGTIKFYNWGNGVPQPLTDVRITDNKIYFKRVIKTREDLIKYGGTAYFEQDFYGIFTEDKKKIKGYYRYAGTQDSWEAVKKQ